MWLHYSGVFVHFLTFLYTSDIITLAVSFAFWSSAETTSFAPSTSPALELLAVNWVWSELISFCLRDNCPRRFWTSESLWTYNIDVTVYIWDIKHISNYNKIRLRYPFNQLYTLYCLNCSNSGNTVVGSGCWANLCWLSAAVAAADSRLA